MRVEKRILVKIFITVILKLYFKALSLMENHAIGSEAISHGRFGKIKSLQYFTESGIDQYFAIVLSIFKLYLSLLAF